MFHRIAPRTVPRSSRMRIASVNPRRFPKQLATPLVKQSKGGKDAAVLVNVNKLRLFRYGPEVPRGFGLYLPDWHEVPGRKRKDLLALAPSRGDLAIFTPGGDDSFLEKRRQTSPDIRSYEAQASRATDLGPRHKNMLQKVLAHARGTKTALICEGLSFWHLTTWAKQWKEVFATPGLKRIVLLRPTVVPAVLPGSAERGAISTKNLQEAVAREINRNTALLMTELTKNGIEVLLIMGGEESEENYDGAAMIFNAYAGKKAAVVMAGARGNLLLEGQKKRVQYVRTVANTFLDTGAVQYHDLDVIAREQAWTKGVRFVHGTGDAAKIPFHAQLNQLS